MDEIECAVIGAGVVGLAIARALALRGREVMVLEAEGAIGSGISSRSSEVIHAGLYYAPGSLKARLCVAGRQALYGYAAQRALPHRRCGKLVVATSQAQVAGLQAIGANARACGVDDLELLTGEEARALEPQLACVAAMLSPSTGIIDSHALMLSLQGDVEAAGGIVVLKCPVAHVRHRDDALILRAQDGSELRSRCVVNAAGLGAPALARRFEGLPPEAVPREHFAKGSYFSMSGRAPFGHLIYPLPEPAGLGVHLTLDLGGQARFGPDVQWVDSPADLEVAPSRAAAFEAEVRRYWPALPPGALQPGYAGIRPKIVGPGEPAADFMIQGPRGHGVPGLVNLFGIESPGLTASLAIGEHVASLLTAS